jgi:hypothetical protein
MIIIKPKHALKLPIDLWGRYANVVVAMYNETGHPNIYAEAIKR